MAIQRNLEANEIYINYWQTGLYSQRSPLYAPVSAMGLQIISRQDTMWDGLNWELSPQYTAVRRPGYGQYSSTSFSGLTPQAFHSFQNLSGTIATLVDTASAVYTFTPSAKTSLFAKSGTAQGSFTDVANTTYYSDGTDADCKKWNQTTVSKWGIVAPVAAPTLSFAGGSLSPSVGYTYCYVYKNSSTGHVSNASPRSASTGPQTSKEVSVGYIASTDPQVDTIEIYRNDDGGSLFYFLADVSNATSNYVDNIPDTGLNDDIIAPLTGNDPPPSGAGLNVFHNGRIWVAAGNNVYFASGPDVTNGVGEESFFLPNIFTFPGAVTALCSTSVGLMIFTADDVYLITGSSLADFQQGLLQKNFGVQNQNCITQDGDTVFVFTSRGQLFQMGGTLNEIGMPIRKKLQAFNTSTTYLALHRSGEDEGLFVSDGSANIYRYSIALSAWCPVAQPATGVSVIQSIETSTSNWTLLAYGATTGNHILARTPGTFLDDGSTYTGFFTVGSLIIAPPGKTAHIDMILLDTQPVGTYPTVSVLLDEISGTFTALPNPVADPPKLVASTTVIMRRHYLKAATAPLAQDIRHLQVRLDFIAENFKSEILGLGVD